MNAVEKVILAVDVPTLNEARTICGMAVAAGATTVKFGLEFMGLYGPAVAGKIAWQNDLRWVCDAKLHDIPQTVERFVAGVCGLYAPVAVTVHASGGVEMMSRAQAAAGDVKILAVSVLTSIEQVETARIYNLDMHLDGDPSPREVQARRFASMADDAGVAGFVCSPREVGFVKSALPNLWFMIPGTRSVGTDAGDQKNVTTPAQAIKDGADALVVGSQVTKAADPRLAFAALLAEIAEKGEGS